MKHKGSQPEAAISFRQPVCENQWCSSMIRMISGIGIPSSQSRIGTLSLLFLFSIVSG
jgi:hypothetical protein